MLASQSRGASRKWELQLLTPGSNEFGLTKPPSPRINDSSHREGHRYLRLQKRWIVDGSPFPKCFKRGGIEDGVACALQNLGFLDVPVAIERH